MCAPLTGEIIIKENSLPSDGGAPAIFRVGAVAYIALKVLALFLLAHNTLYVMDEFQQGGYPKHIAAGFYQAFYPLKTILFAYFYWPAYELGESSNQTMLIARYQTALLGVAVLGFVYLVSRNMGRDKMEALFAVCVTLAFSTFMERVFRVRSEPLALFFAMTVLWLLTLENKTRRKILWAGLLSGAAFLTTQKAVYFNVAFGLAIVGEGLIGKDYKGAIIRGAIYTSGWVAAILLYGIYFRGAQFPDVIRHIFVAPMRLAAHGGDYYPNLAEFIYQTLYRNVLPYSLCFAGLAIAFVKRKTLSPSGSIALIATSVITILVFRHNQPWPYVFIMAIPFLALFSVEAPKALMEMRPNVMRWALVALLCVFFFSFERNIGYFGNSNVAQNRVSMVAESLLGPDDYYCDGVGMLVQKRFTAGAWWDARALKGIEDDAKKDDYSKIENVFAFEPKVWVLNYRVQKLMGLLGPYLKRSYVRIYPNVLVSGAPLDGRKETIFVNRWKGAYRLYSANGERLKTPVYVNGELLEGPIVLAVGKHTLGLEDGARGGYFLPEDIRGRFTIPPGSPPFYLFPKVYNY